MTNTYAIPNSASLRTEMLKVWEAVKALVDGELAQQTDWHGIRLAPEEWKDLLSAGLVKAKVVPNIEGTGFVILGQRTSKFTVAQMNEMIELIHAFGTERGVRFSADPRMLGE